MIKVYADLNCPFCFALSERLHQAGIGADWEWAYIEHAPELNSQVASDQQIQQLREECEMVRRRAADVSISYPGFCVNTRLANLTLLAVAMQYPGQVAAFRVGLYRAYWQQGRDISQKSVINDVLADISLPSLDYSAHEEKLQYQSNEQWRSGQFDQRIPAIEGPGGRKLLGLQHIYNIENFISGGSGQKSGDSCLAHKLSIVALIGMPSETETLQNLPGNFQFVGFNDIESFITYSQYQHVSAVLLAIEQGEQQWRSLVALQEVEHLDSHLPVIIVVDQLTANDETHAFAFGANDVVQRNSVNAKLLPRLKKRVATYHALENLSEYASIDSLTGLYNRRLFDRRLEEEWRNACRSKVVLSLVLIDIDNFKQFNDEYGHGCGDECLVRVAGALRDQLKRPIDIAARYGGEEFVLLLPETNEAGALLVAEKVRQAVAAIHLDQPLGITISGGVVTASPHADQTPEELLALADDALYRAKRAGKNQVVNTLMKLPAYV